MEKEKEFLEALKGDGYILVTKKLIKNIGLVESIIYSELVSRYMYFKNKNQLTPDGFFYNTIEDLADATSIGEKPQKNAINNLQKLELIEYKLKGIPPKRHFKVIIDIQLISKYSKNILPEKFRPNGEIDFSHRADINSPIGRTNNNHLNNKDLIIKNLNVVVAERTDGYFFKKLFEYYFEKYFTYTGKHHPELNKTAVKMIVDNIDNFANEYEIRSLKNWTDMVDYYYRCSLDCDRNMLHFSQYEILYNRADNLNKFYHN